MRTWFPRLLPIAALALLAPDAVVSAETVGGFTFTIPEGWSACTIDIEGFNQFYCNANHDGAIAIQSPATAADANTLAHQDLEGVEIVNEQEAVFAGKAGQVVIGRVKQGDKYVLVAIAATVEAGGARVGLLAAPEVVDQSVQAWSAMIDQGSFGGPAPEANQKFTISNVGEGCAATATVDGKSIELAPGASQEIMLTEGKHEFTWTDSTGAPHSATADVPPADTLGAACVVGGAPPPSPQTDIPDPTAADRAMFEGARAAVKFYRILGNLVIGKPLLDPTPKSDRPMLRVLAERPDDRLGTMHEYTDYLAVLQAAVDKSGNDPTKLAALRRLALVMLAQAGQIGGVSQACNQQQGTAMLDCVVEDYTKSDVAEVVAEWGRTFARIGNAPNPTDSIVELQKLAQ